MPPAPPKVRAVALAAVLGGLAACFPSADPDLWFHLALGRQMVESGGIPEVEGLCVLSRGQPFTNHEWLWDLGVYGLWEAFGLPGVLSLRLVSSAFLFGLSMTLALRLGAGTWAALFALGLAVPVVRPWLADRPHVLAYALAASVSLDVVGPGPGDRWRPLRLAGLSALWANVHGSFPVAVALSALPLIRRETWTDPSAWRRALGMPLLVSLATFLNPWGPRLYATVLHHGGDVYRLLSEWAPWRFAEDPARDLALVLLVGGAAGGFLLRSRRRDLGYLLWLLFFLVPFWRAEKFAPGLIVAAAPVLAAHLAFSGRPRCAWVWGLALVLPLALTGLARPGPTLRLSLDLQEMPRESLAFARQAGWKGPVFHPFNVGGYVAFFGHPDLQALLDGRIYIHGSGGLQTYFRALGSEAALRDLVRSLGLTAVLVDRQDASFQGLIEALRRDPGQALVYLDDRFGWFRPAGEGPRPFRVLRAGTDPRYLLDLGDEEARQAQDEARRVRDSGRGEETWHLVAGLLALREAGGRWSPESVLDRPLDLEAARRAVEHLEEVSRLRPDVPMFGYFRGLALAAAGRCAEARQALAAARAFPDARRLLDLLPRDECPGSDPGGT